MTRTVVLLFLLGSSAAAQDFQVGARAKAMGGSYTAFGDDPVATWINPAGIAGQPTQFAFTYQSFTQYEFNDVDDPIAPDVYGAPEAGLLDPPISPSFAGIVVQLGGQDLEVAVSVAYVRPFQIKYVYFFDDPALGQLLTQTDQQYSRIRTSGAIAARTGGSRWFTRAAGGLALDYCYTKYKEIDQNPDPVSETLVFEDSESTVAFGAGVLLTVYEAETFQVDAGAAFNSKADFDFDLDKSIYPVWDWPALFSAGLAIYLLEGYPLRVTLDLQTVDWTAAVGPPDAALTGFTDTLSFSAGAEYRIPLKETKWLYLRGGWKSYDTPWESTSSPPAVGLSVLQIESRGDRMEILTLGFGLTWSRKTADGETRVSGLDVAVELLGEVPVLIGIAYTYQLD